MARKELTLNRYNEIVRLLDLNISANKISKALKCSRNTIKKIKFGKLNPLLSKDKNLSVLSIIDWKKAEKDFTHGKHALKFIWEEQAQDLISYSGFWKQFYKLYPKYKNKFVTHRFFSPGEYCEVDYAGGTVEYVNLQTGAINKANIFIGALCHSHYLYAVAKPNMKSENFLDCHRLMYEHFKGVPLVTVPDCLKQGVTKTHIYDPDINTSYSDLASHYSTAIVPARPRKPKDKAVIEGAVGIVMRYFKFRYRDHQFTSVAEINKALFKTIEIINNKVHTRFKISRKQMWFDNEKDKLKPLPLDAFEYTEWKESKVHPDTHICIRSNYYSVPHIYRGKTVKVKIGKTQIEIFYNMERIALHTRSTKTSKYTTEMNHLPTNARAYHAATPQNLLSQAKFINTDLHKLIDDIFKKDAVTNIRRVQGLIRESKKEISDIGHNDAKIIIAKACEDMNMFSKIRVPYFRELLNKYKKQKVAVGNNDIQRIKNNPMLRYQQVSFDNVLLNKQNKEDN
jgi:transposase